MAVKLCPDRLRVTIMVLATCAVLALPSAWGQIGVLLVAAVVGRLLCKPGVDATQDPLPITVSRRAALLWLGLFVLLLAGLPLLARAMPGQALAMVDAFFRAGALVFGGGHVVLPLLQAEVVTPGWVGADTFLAGYGAAQAVPGPLFSFAAFLGASSGTAPTGWAGGLIALCAIFAPSFLLVLGALPFWESLRRNRQAQAALAGVNAAVVGLLLAALYQPVWTSAIHGPQDFALALVALGALMFWKLPPWLVVLGCGLAGWVESGIL